MAAAGAEWLVLHMLDGLTFPAQHWQLLAQAQLNGADAVTLERLRALPERTYRTWTDIASALTTSRATRHTKTDKQIQHGRSPATPTPDTP
jgi:hypothetical protein